MTHYEAQWNKGSVFLPGDRAQQYRGTDLRRVHVWHSRTQRRMAAAPETTERQSLSQASKPSPKSPTLYSTNWESALKEHICTPFSDGQYLLLRVSMLSYRRTDQSQTNFPAYAETRTACSEFLLWQQIRVMMVICLEVQILFQPLHPK